MTGVVVLVEIDVVGHAEINLADNGEPLYAWAMVTSENTDTLAKGRPWYIYCLNDIVIILRKR